MANATSTIEEVRFDLRDEQITHVYVLSRAGGDAPIGVQGWHYKAFPARIPMVEILTPHYISDYLLWPLKAPEQHGSYMTINADGALSPETEDALAYMGQLVIEQYAEQDKGSAVEDVDLTQIAAESAAAAAARWRERALAAEAALAAVPVEAIYYVHLAAKAHSRDNGHYASQDIITVGNWLADQPIAQALDSEEAQP